MEPREPPVVNKNQGRGEHPSQYLIFSAWQMANESQYSPKSGCPCLRLRVVGHTADDCRLSIAHEVTCESGCARKAGCVALWQLVAGATPLARETIGSIALRTPKDPTPPPPHGAALGCSNSWAPRSSELPSPSNYNSILGRETGSDEAISIAIFCCIFFLLVFFSNRQALLLIIPLFAPPHRPSSIVHRVARLPSPVCIAALGQICERKHSAHAHAHGHAP
jgi:hypothetical protein